jgi:autotransporter-associated beta strand protein
MKPTPFLRHLLAALGSATLAISSASAQLTWDANDVGAGQTDGAGGWLDALHWWDGSTNVDWTSGSDAIFGTGGTGAAVTLASPTTAGSLTFNAFSGTYTLGTTGQALTINSGITMNAGSGEVTFASPIILGGAQSWLNNASGVDTTLRVNSTIDNGGFDLTLGGTSTSINRGDSNFLLNGIISGSGGLNKSGDGVLWLLGANTYTGATTVTGGVLRNQSGNLSGMTSGLITLNGGVLESYWNDTFTRSLGDGTNPNEIQLTGGASGFSQHGSAGLTVTLNNNATTPIQWGSTHFNPSTLVFMSIYSNGGANVTFNNALDLNGAQRAIEVNQGAGFTNVRAQMNGVLGDTVGGAGITKTGDGTLILNNNSNSYDGPTIVNGGVLQIGTAFNAGNLSVPGGYTSNPTTGSNLELNGGIVSYWFSFNRTLGTGAGQLQLTGGRSGFTIKQGDRVDLTFNTAATEVQWGSAVFNPSTLVLNDAAAAPSSPIRFNNLLDLNGANRTVEVANFTTTINTNPAATGTFSRVINNGAVFNNNIRNTDVDDTAELIKTGVGILGLNGTNTYDGGTTVNQGGVFFNNLASMPATGDVSLASGTSLIVTVGGAGKWSTATSGNGTIGGLLAGLGGQSGSTVTYSGAATLGLNVSSGTQTYAGDVANVAGSSSTGFAVYGDGGSGVMELSGTNTFTGGIGVNSGATTILSGDHSGASGGVALNHGYLQSSPVNMIGGTVTFSSPANGTPAIFATSGTLNREINAAGGVFWNNPGGFAATDSALTVTLESGNTLVWNNANTGFNGRTLQLGSPTSTASVEVTNNITLNGNYTVQLFDNPATSADVSTLSGNIVRDGTNNRNLDVTGSGTLVLSGSNDFGVGQFSLNGGAVVRAIDGSGLPTNARFRFNNGVLESSGSFTRNIADSGGNVYWNNAGGFAAHGGTLNVNLNGGATIDWAANNGFRGQTLILGSSTANNVVTLQNDIDLKGNRTITVNDNADSTADYAVLSGVLANGDATARNLTKNGAGTLLLNGINTYTGDTTVSAGTLGGTGTIAGNVIVNTAANLAPGASAGTLTINGNLTISAMAGGAGLLKYELATLVASDKIVLPTGTLDIGSDALGLGDFELTDLGGLQNGTYKLIETSQPITGTLAGDTNGTLGSATIDLQLSGDGTDLELVVSGLGASSPYETWAGPGVLFDGDANGDGVSNGLAFLLGAADPDADALGLLPIVTEDNGALVLTFSCLNDANNGDATLAIEHSSDLGIGDAWVAVAVPDTTPDPQAADVSFVITPNGNLNDVVATIQSGEAAAGKLFARLKAEP